MLLIVLGHGFAIVFITMVWLGASLVKREATYHVNAVVFIAALMFVRSVSNEIASATTFVFIFIVCSLCFICTHSDVFHQLSSSKYYH